MERLREIKLKFETNPKKEPPVWGYTYFRKNDDPDDPYSLVFRGDWSHRESPQMNVLHLEDEESGVKLAAFWRREKEFIFVIAAGDSEAAINQVFDNHIVNRGIRKIIYPITHG